MTAAVYLSRATLRDDAPVEAAGAFLAAHGLGARALSGHHLVWSLFGDDAARRRDFLWREDDGGRFHLLSTRPPTDRLGVFTLEPPREFAPALEPGDRLRFSLRVNATISRRSVDGDGRGKPCDIVMDAIHRLSATGDARAATRQAVLQDVARRWLAARGERHGFTLVGNSDDAFASAEMWETVGRDPLRVVAYRTLRIPRPQRAPAMRIGVLDLEGELIVDDPVKLVARIVRGFGRARGFGCGLMLVRRAR